jgi:hypothetical protein
MSKWIVFIVLALIFNVVMGVVFVLANNSLWDFIMTEIDHAPPPIDEGLYQVVPYIHISGFEVSLSHHIYINGTIGNLGPLPAVVPNYPYMLFWVCIIGNFIFVALALVLHKSKSREAS